MNSGERWAKMRAAIADQMGPDGPRPNQVFLLPDGCKPDDLDTGMKRVLEWPKIGVDDGKDDRTVIVKHDAHGRVAEVNVTSNPTGSSIMATEFVRWREQRIAQLQREHDAHLREDIMDSITRHAKDAEHERRSRASVLGLRTLRLEEDIIPNKTATEVMLKQQEANRRMEAILHGHDTFRSKLRDAYALDERERAEQEIAGLRQQVAELETKFKHLMKVHMDLVCMTAMPPVIVTGPTKVAHGGTSEAAKPDAWKDHPMQDWMDSVAPETAKPTPAGLTMTAPMTHRFGGWGA